MAVERLYLMSCGYARAFRGIFYQGGGIEPVEIPILCAVLVHSEKGPVVVDTGFGPHTRAHVGRFPEGIGRWLLPGVTLPELDLRHQMRKAGLEPEEVRHGILTHLHNDHTGGLCDFADTTFHLAYEELRAAREFGRLRGIFNGFTLVEFEGIRFEFDDPRPDPSVPIFGRSHDLFGDGSIRLIPTPGHTAGHRSVWVTLASGRELLLAGDACYHQKSYLTPARPHWLIRNVAWDVDQAWGTILGLRRLSRLRPDLTIIPFHDFDLWPQLEQAPGYYS